MTNSMKLTMATVTLFFVTQLQANDIRCQVADQNNVNPMKVALTVVDGFMNTKPVITLYGGHRISAMYYKGDAFEKQALLVMQADDVSSKTYGPNNASTYQLHTAHLLMQCWFVTYP